MSEYPKEFSEAKTYAPTHRNAFIPDMKTYRAMYERSINNPDQFWSEEATNFLSWFRTFDKVRQGGFEYGDQAWFLGGKLNGCYNCVDRHVEKKGDQVAILYEGDTPDDVRKVTYNELLREVCKFANSMKRMGVKKGDCVCIYMPMVPEAAIAMLACARLGAPHSVVFAGYSDTALAARCIDGNCKYLVCTDFGHRAGKKIPLKAVVDRAMKQCPLVETVWVLRRHKELECGMVEGRDLDWVEATQDERPYCPCEVMDAEDTLFYLYTSGSTGKPKGVQHCTGGYLLYTGITQKYVFDYRPGDIYACMADVGWITGHSYIVYGPLVNGATTFMFEGTPVYPDAGRYWDMVQRHKITQFYTAPTAIRLLMKSGEEIVKKYDRSSLRVLGSVGEPINPEAWKWYFEVVGDCNAHICDTYWQTETGGHTITGLGGCTPMKAGSASLPFFGIDPVVMTTEGKEIEGNEVAGVLAFRSPWPGMVRTVAANHVRFMNTYLTTYPGKYFTGDGCARDKDGYLWITGRVDDVINVSGHRIGSAEIESALVEVSEVAESAVVGVPHAVKGQALFAYVILKNDAVESKELVLKLRNHVKVQVGSFAKPDHIMIIPGLPKTRSGKIMRRVLRKIACGASKASLGDTSTMADPAVVDVLITKLNALMGKKK